MSSLSVCDFLNRQNHPLFQWVGEIGISITTHAIANAILPSLNGLNVAKFGIGCWFADKAIEALSPINLALSYRIATHAFVPSLLGMLAVHTENNSFSYTQACSLHVLSRICSILGTVAIAKACGINVTDLFKREIFFVEKEETRLGCFLIINDILSEAPDTEIEAFREMAHDFFPFLMTKTIFLFALGNKRKENIPFLFFHRDTLNFIETLRNNDKEVLISLSQPFLMRFASFHHLPEDPDAIALVHKIRAAAMSEVRKGQSLLITHSYLAARKEI